jgi:hypothetical protein
MLNRIGNLLGDTFGMLIEMVLLPLYLILGA